MQDLLTLTLEMIAIAAALVMFLDFVSGLANLYNVTAASGIATTQEAPTVEPTTSIEPEETAPLDDPWTVKVEESIESPYCRAIASPAEIALKIIYLLPPKALEVADLPVIDYSGWTIRALKKEAQNRKLSKYSSLTKTQLISRLTAA